MTERETTGEHPAAGVRLPPHPGYTAGWQAAERETPFAYEPVTLLMRAGMEARMAPGGDGRWMQEFINGYYDWCIGAGLVEA